MIPQSPQPISVGGVFRLSKKPIIKQKRIEAHGTKASLV